MHAAHHLAPCLVLTSREMQPILLDLLKRKKSPKEEKKKKYIYIYVEIYMLYSLFLTGKSAFALKYSFLIFTILKIVGS